MSDQVDLLAIAAHRDDVELTCGGTLAKAAMGGRRVGIIDLTQGEMGNAGRMPRRARPKRSGREDAGRRGAAQCGHARCPSDQR